MIAINMIREVVVDARTSRIVMHAQVYLVEMDP